MFSVSCNRFNGVCADIHFFIGYYGRRSTCLLMYRKSIMGYQGCIWVVTAMEWREKIRFIGKYAMKSIGGLLKQCCRNKYIN